MGKYFELQKKLGYQFSDVKLLSQSLTHSSYINESGLSRSTDNERLEFLGDSLLGMAVTVLLYNHNPVLTEGEMSKLRARLVCERELSLKATELDLGANLLLGRGEDIGGGRTRPSILADAFEAVIAAMYLDGGFEPVLQFVKRTFGAQIDKPVKSGTDYKTSLQEHIQDQNKHNHSIVYKLTGQEGPDHNKTFTVDVIINGKTKGTGTGKSKKAAEQAAAKNALDKLNNE